jgi:hypothetical protein
MKGFFLGNCKISIKKRGMDMERNVIRFLGFYQQKEAPDPKALASHT